MRAHSFLSLLTALALSLPAFCVPTIPDDALVLLPVHIRDFETASGIERRGLGDYSALDPRTNVPLIYGRDDVLANLTLYPPDGHQVVSLEEFDDLTSKVDCKGDDGEMSLTMRSPEAFEYACNKWDFVNQNEMKKFLLIANHKGCGPDDQRQPYWILNVNKGPVNLTIQLTASIAQWEQVAGTFDMDFGKAIQAPEADAPARKEKRFRIGHTIKHIQDAVTPVVDQAAAVVAPVVDQAAAVVAPVVDQAAAVVAPVVNDGVNAVVDTGAAVVDNAAPVVNDVANAVVDTGAAVVNNAAPVVNDVANTVVDAGAAVVNSAAPVVNDAANTVVDAGAAVVNNAAPVVNDATNAVVNAGSAVVNNAAPVINDATNAVVDAGPAVAQMGGQVANDVVKTGGQVANDVVKTGGQVANDAIKTGGQVANDVVKTGGQVANEVVKTGGQVANDVVKTGGQVANTVVKTGGQVANNVGKTTGQAATDAAKYFKKLGTINTGRKAVTVDATIGQPGVRTNIIKSDSLVLDCVNCYVKGTFEISGSLKTKDFAILDLILDTRLVNVFAVLRLQAAITASDKIESLSKQLEYLSFGLPGAGVAVPGIFSIGATAAYSLGAETKVRGRGVLDFGLTAGIPNNARVLTNVRKILESKAVNFLGAPITPIFEVKALTADVSFTAYSLAKISFGVEIAQIGKAEAAVLFKIPSVTAQFTTGFSKTGFCSNAKGASTTGVRLDSKYDFNINTAWLAKLGPIGPADADIYGITQPLLSTCYELPIGDLAPPVGARFRRT